MGTRDPMFSRASLTSLHEASKNPPSLYQTLNSTGVCAEIWQGNCNRLYTLQHLLLKRLSKRYTIFFNDSTRIFWFTFGALHRGTHEITWTMPPRHAQRRLHKIYPRGEGSFPWLACGNTIFCRNFYLHFHVNLPEEVFICGGPQFSSMKMTQLSYVNKPLGRTTFQE